MWSCARQIVSFVLILLLYNEKVNTEVAGTSNKSDNTFSTADTCTYQLQVAT